MARCEVQIIAPGPMNPGCLVVRFLDGPDAGSIRSVPADEVHSTTDAEDGDAS